MAGKHRGGIPWWMEITAKLTIIRCAALVFIVMLAVWPLPNGFSLEQQTYGQPRHLTFSDKGDSRTEQVRKKYLQDMADAHPNDYAEQRSFALLWICRYGDDPVAFKVSTRIYDKLAGGLTAWIDGVNAVCPEFFDNDLPDAPEAPPPPPLQAAFSS